DEIGDIDIQLQAKLLRVIETKSITRLGGSRNIQLDFRVITATHRDLAAEIGCGQFREDLFYRLNVLNIHIPPLRQRKNELEQITRNLIRELNFERDFFISNNALKKLACYDFPGNIRELKNIIERALIFSESDKIDADDIIFPENRDILQNAEPASFKEARLKFEKSFFLEQLQLHGWNVTHTARKLQMGRRTLQEKIKRLGIEVNHS
ncbi:sigma 54-interacting transcriptional regulator, partial [Candidatus Riflebacteria bacterium]